MSKCCILGCDKEQYWFLLCEDHDAFSKKNEFKPMPTGDLTFTYGGKPVKIIDFDEPTESL